MKQRQRRVGVYAGTFDPVHAGHIAFALQAAATARLDCVYLLPERQPRTKQHATHYAHRVAMVRAAIKPHSSLQLLELPDKSFSVLGTLSRLQARFPGAQLVFLVGSDVLDHMAAWPHIATLLNTAELAVCLRKDHTKPQVMSLLNSLPMPPQRIHYLYAVAPYVSSSKIRQALRDNLAARGLLESVRLYARKQWLYLRLKR